MMNIPDNADLYDMYDREQAKGPNPVLECDLCGEPIFEGQGYLRIEQWDKCVCERCADDIGVWEVADGDV